MVLDVSPMVEDYRHLLSLLFNEMTNTVSISFLTGSRTVKTLVGRGFNGFRPDPFPIEREGLQSNL